MTLFVSILISQLEKEYVNTHNHNGAANVDWFSNIPQILLGNFQLQILLINSSTISSKMENQYERHQTPATAKKNRPPPYNFWPNPQILALITSTPITNSNMGLHFPYGNVDSSLRVVTGHAEGWGRFAINGLHDPVYELTTLAGTKEEEN